MFTPVLKQKQFMEGFAGIMMMLGSAMETGDLVKRLKESIAEYEADPTNKTMSSIEFHCQLILSKSITNVKPVDEVLKDLETHSKIHKLADIKQQ